MRLDELAWITSYTDPGAKWTHINRRGGYRTLIFKRPGGSYSFWLNDGYYIDNLDALTAQALLFELLKVTPK